MWSPPTHWIYDIGNPILLFIGFGFGTIEMFKYIISYDHMGMEPRDVLERKHWERKLGSVKTPHDPEESPKQRFRCECKYEFSVDTDKYPRVVCPWCGRVLKEA